MNWTLLNPYPSLWHDCLKCGQYLEVCELRTLNPHWKFRFVQYKHELLSMLYKPDNCWATSSSSSFWKLSTKLELQTRVGYVECLHLLGMLAARINCVLRDCCCVINGVWQSTGHICNNSNIIWKLFKRIHQTPVFISGWNQPYIRMRNNRIFDM
jgi:hypothetical protein